MKHYPLFLLLGIGISLVLTSFAAAQEMTAEPPLQPEPPRPSVMPMVPRMNPAMLLKMRTQLTFELQQTQRALGFIDPNDQQITTTLKDQQAELTSQLKEINEQLRTQGISADNGESIPTVSVAPPIESIKPVPPKTEVPTLPGGLPDSNLLIQQREPYSPYPPYSPVTNSVPPSPISGTTIPKAAIPGQKMPDAIAANSGVFPPPLQSPTGFDQDQAWANSPWVPQPSKELTELKLTVDSLRKEISEMKENVKTLETQIQLLNRNILLSQPTSK
jgi:hypothetical protein